MSTLGIRYYNILEKMGGAWMSAHVGGVGQDGDPSLYVPILEFLKKNNKEAEKLGLKPQRKKKK